MDHNLNLAECLQKVSNFGQTTIMNICNGKVTEVPWGSADWAIAITIIFLFGSLALVMLAVAVMIIRT